MELKTYHAEDRDSFMLLKAEGDKVTVEHDGEVLVGIKIKDGQLVVGVSVGLYKGAPKEYDLYSLFYGSPKTVDTHRIVKNAREKAGK